MVRGAGLGDMEMSQGGSQMTPIPFNCVIIRPMRHWLVLLWIAALLAGQACLCQAEYVFRDGRACQTCPTISCFGASLTDSSSGSDVSASHGDCHDCCTLSLRCGGKEHQPVNAVNVLPIPAAVLPDVARVLHLVTLVAVQQQFWFVLGAPPTGPPTFDFSRAPPL